MQLTNKQTTTWHGEMGMGMGSYVGSDPSHEWIHWGTI